jgi:hypothetical protein
LHLPEPIGNQSAQRSECRFGVGASRANRDLRALLTTKQKHAHDALGVCDLTVLADLDV